MSLTLDEIRRLDQCITSCIESPHDAVTHIEPDKLRRWLEYAEGQIWNPKHVRLLIRAARKRLQVETGG